VRGQPAASGVGAARGASAPRAARRRVGATSTS